MIAYTAHWGCRHSLSVDLINKKQLLFVPVLQTKVISEAATIYDYPMDAEEIGRVYSAAIRLH